MCRRKAKVVATKTEGMCISECQQTCIEAMVDVCGASIECNVNQSLDSCHSLMVRTLTNI